LGVTHVRNDVYVVQVWIHSVTKSELCMIVASAIHSQRQTEEKARQPETRLGAIAQTRHTARLRNAKRSRTTHGARDRPNQPQSMETAHWSPASGTRRDVRARPTQGRVAPAKGTAKLPERPRDEGGPREARPASLHGLVAKSPSSVRAGLKAPEGLDWHRHEGQGGGHLPIRTPLQYMLARFRRAVRGFEL
jgi:hypothetical protein